MLIDGNQNEWLSSVDGNGNPDTPVTASKLNQPFHIESASYDSGSDTLTVTVGPGQIAWGDDTIITKTSSTDVNKSSINANDTYYVYIDNSGNFSIETDNTADATQRRLGNVTTDGSKNVSGRNDGRSHMPHALLGVKDNNGNSLGVFSVIKFTGTTSVNSNGEIEFQATNSASELTGSSSGDLNSESKTTAKLFDGDTQTLSFDNDYSVGCVGAFPESIPDGNPNFEGSINKSGGNITGYTVTGVDDDTANGSIKVTANIFGVIA